MDRNDTVSSAPVLRAGPIELVPITGSEQRSELNLLEFIPILYHKFHIPLLLFEGKSDLQNQKKY